MNNKIALITGTNGQDGSYLAEYLLSLGYKVEGIARNSMTNPKNNMKNFLYNENFKLIEGDLTDPVFVDNLEYDKYDEVYHLAAQSHVGLSFKIPSMTHSINYASTLRLLDRYFTKKPTGKFYFAATSELYGDIPGPQNEETLFHPVSPYAEAKLKAYDACQVFKNAGRFVCSGILFNHESQRRGAQFVTQKIIQAILKYKQDENNNILLLGNLESKRDWGYSKEYAEAMHLMLQHSNPDNYVIATNETHTIKEFVEMACQEAQIKFKIIENMLEEKDYSEIENLEELKLDRSTFYILQSKEFFRPSEVNFLQGDYSKAEKILGWKPKTNLKELIQIMLKGE